MIIEKYLKYLDALMERKSIQSPIFRGQLDSFDTEGKLRLVISTAARRLNYSLAKEKGDILTQSRFINKVNG